MTDNSTTRDSKYQRLWDNNVYFRATHIEVAHDNNPAQWWWLEPEGSGTNRSAIRNAWASSRYDTGIEYWGIRYEGPWTGIWSIRVHCECKADAHVLKKPGLWDFQSAGKIIDEVNRIN